MKMTLPRQEFQDALTAITSLTGSRTTKPILSCVKLSTKDDVLRLAATDGEAALRLSISAFRVDTPGEAAVPAERLLGIVRELGDAEIRLESDERYCVIRGQGSELRIFVQSPADFPSIPEFDDEADLVVDGAQLWRMISLTIYAAARETSRFAINGVLWEKQGKRLFMVATDGRRLARAGGPVSGGRVADFQAIIPAKALNIFERVFTPPKEKGDWTVDIKILPNQVMLRSGDRVLSTALVEGHFPKYQDVIPKDADKCARMNRLELYSSVRRAALVTTEESRAVKFAFGLNELVLTAQSPDQGDARIVMPISYEGAPVEIAFNPTFVNDALRVLTYENVQIELQESFRPGIICGDDKNDFLYVVMPVSL